MLSLFEQDNLETEDNLTELQIFGVIYLFHCFMVYFVSICNSVHKDFFGNDQ